MKIFINIVLQLTGLLTTLSAQNLSKPVWTEMDRQFLVEGLKTSQIELMKELEGLSEAECNFKPDSSQWSVNEILEHLAVYEEHLCWDLLYGIFTPERLDQIKEVQDKDEVMLAYESDPNKGQAPWVAQPLGRFDNKIDLINFHNKFRDSVISFVKSTKADLRLHFIYREPTSGIWQAKDLHQQTLLYIAHTKRHTNQIRRVKAHKNYPKNGKLWTEADRQYTIENFKRTRNELVKETENLTLAQWNFREAPGRWTIGEIVEHLGIWERVWSREINMATRNKPQPELSAIAKPDSMFNIWIMEEKAHNAPDFAKPTGLIEGRNNLTYFLIQHDINIKFVETTQLDMRVYFEQTNKDPRDLHQVLIFQWGHVDRHLRQIKKVKSHQEYPK